MTAPSQHEPGRAAIDRALDALYPGQIDLRFAGFRRADGNPPSLVEFTVYPCEETTPHWHFVSYGLSEVFGKQTADPEVSGYGLELTLRVVREPGSKPPPWPARILTYLADYVFDTGNGFGPLHTMALSGVPMRSLGTELESVLFVEDPRLPPVVSSNGRLQFLQVLGITSDEEDLIARWDANRFLEFLAPRPSVPVTDLRRASLLRTPSVAEEIRAAAKVEGSSREVIYLSALQVEHSAGMDMPVTLRLGLAEGRAVAQLLRYRIGYQRRANLLAPHLVVQLVPAAEHYEPWTGDDGEKLTLGIPPDRIEPLAAALEGPPGTYRWPWFSALTIERTS